METKVEFYLNVTNRNDHKSYNYGSIINYAIKTKSLKGTDKKNLPAVQWAGTFSGTGKSEDIINLSGLMVLDFDHVENYDIKFKDLKNDPYVHIMFRSPSGDGIKVLIKHSIDNPRKWKEQFRQAAVYFNSVHHLTADGSGSDISRMCFIPYMEKGSWWVNKESKLFPYEEKEIKEKTIEDYMITDPEVIKLCYEAAEYIKKHNFLFCEDYDVWLSLGFSLALLPEEDGRKIFHILSSTSKKYDEKRTDEKFTNCVNSLDPDIARIETYLYRAQRWIFYYVLKQERTKN